jgi:hypothetical protein
LDVCQGNIQKAMIRIAGEVKFVMGFEFQIGGYLRTVVQREGDEPISGVGDQIAQDHFHLVLIPLRYNPLQWT